MGSSSTTYAIPWPPLIQNLLAQFRVALLDVYQVTAVDCWAYVDFCTFIVRCARRPFAPACICDANAFGRVTCVCDCVGTADTPYYMTVMMTLGFLVSAVLLHGVIPKFAARCFPQCTTERVTMWRSNVVKYTGTITLSQVDLVSYSTLCCDDHWWFALTCLSSNFHDHFLSGYARQSFPHVDSTVMNTD